MIEMQVEDWTRIQTKLVRSGIFEIPDGILLKAGNIVRLVFNDENARVIFALKWLS